MNRIVVEIAGHTVGLEWKLPHRYTFKRFISDKAPEAVFSASYEEIAAECEYPVEAESVVVHRKLTQWLLREFGIVLMHGVAIEADGYGVIFTAPSGTGKSTHARLWKQLLGDRATIVNGDKTFLEFLDDGKIMAYGSPWCGKEGICENMGVGLDAIVVLHQAETDTIERIDSFEALFPVSSQVYIPETLRGAELDGMLDRIHLLSSLPVYSLGCTPTIDAARLAYQTITGKKPD